jgi:hypothetical protein
MKLVLNLKAALVMAKRGRPKGVRNGQGTKAEECTYCEGTKFHMGRKCGACDSTGLRKVQIALDTLYRVKNGGNLRQKQLNR